MSLTIHPDTTVMIGQAYAVSYRDHLGKLVEDRPLRYLGERESEVARQFYPCEPGPVAMLDWEEVGGVVMGASIRLGFRASDLIRAVPLESRP